MKIYLSEKDKNALTNSIIVLNTLVAQVKDCGDNALHFTGLTKFYADAYIPVEDLIKAVEALVKVRASDRTDVVIHPTIK